MYAIECVLIMPFKFTNLSNLIKNMTWEVYWVSTHDYVEEKREREKEWNSECVGEKNEIERDHVGRKIMKQIYNAQNEWM